MGISTIIKVAGQIPANATTDSIVSVDMPEDGSIMCIGGLIIPTYTLAAGVRANNTLQCVAELSFNSTNQIGSNDARGTIAGVGVAVNEVWSEVAETGGAGAKFSEQNSLCIEGGIEVNAGERIHLHGLTNSLNLVADVTFLLYIKQTGGGRRHPKRR